MNFYTQFDLLKETLKIFNSRCDCSKSVVEITFVSSLFTTDPNVAIQSEWEVKVKGDFLKEPFVVQGNLADVFEEIAAKINELAQNFIELMIANVDEWYDGKIKNEIYDLYKKLLETKI